MIAAIGLHAALFSLPVRQVRPLAEMHAHGKSVEVRALTGGAEPLRAEDSAKRDIIPDQQALAPVAPESRQSAPMQEKIGTNPLPSPVPPPSAFGLLASARTDDGDYFTRDQLSVGPNPTDLVVIDYPPIDSQDGNHVSELSLFIDEAGRVVRVRVDGPRLPAALEDAVRSAFMIARFSPGMVDGLPVRSRIRIEVSFLTTSIPR